MLWVTPPMGQICPIRAPFARFLRHPLLRKEYEEQIKGLSKDGEDVASVMKSVKRSFDANLLVWLCEVCLDVYLDCVIDDFLLEKICEITDNVQSQYAADQRNSRDELCLDMTKKGVDASG
ncbi:hypothetical protein PInf_010011 [Phytophthora infestans]|nr:hypothetical protein PInf_010011 [Phytophthora infestans]